MSHAAQRGDAPALARLGERIAARAGLAVPVWVLASRVHARMAALGISSVIAYVDSVLSVSGAAELETLLEAVRVGETRFFRHPAQVDALVHEVVPGLIANRERGVIRAWSAGCASGEEAYTVAMVLADIVPASGVRVSVLGTDVSAQAIEVARRGEYPAHALAHVPERLRASAFVPSGDGAMVRVAPAISRLVAFEQKNLLDSGPRDIDILWCRNVLIYFDRDARARVVASLLASLSDHGVLFVGSSEALGDEHEVEVVRSSHGVMYRRRRADRGPVRASDEARLRLTGRYQGSARLSAELSQALARSGRRLVVDIDGAELLDDGAAPALRRARSAARAVGVELVLAAERTGPLRWLRRHGLDTPDDTRGGEE